MDYCEAHLERTGEKVLVYRLGLCKSCYQGKAIRHSELSYAASCKEGPRRGLDPSGARHKYKRAHRNLVESRQKRCHSDVYKVIDSLPDLGIATIDPKGRKTILVQSNLHTVAQRRGMRISAKLIDGLIHVRLVDTVSIAANRGEAI
jgi:hypothetical protein